MASIRDVAKLADVSTATVSHVINGTRYVSSELTERVQAALQALDYSPDTVARSLRRGETLTIGLIVPSLKIPFMASVAYNVERAASRRGYSIILCNSDWEQAEEIILLQNLIARKVDGLICISPGMSAAQVEPIVNLGTPVVTFERKLINSGLDAVSIDNYKGAYIGTRHLLDLGHQRIAAIKGLNISSISEARLHGYTDALRDAGLELNPNYVVSGDYLFETGEQAALRLLSLPKRPTAIFTFNDLMAMGVLRLLNEKGLSVPDEVAVMGFDDIPMCQYTIPTLTTIRQPLEEMGALAVELLLQRITSEHHYAAKHVELQPELIIRASTGSQLLHEEHSQREKMAHA